MPQSTDPLILVNKRQAPTCDDPIRMSLCRENATMSKPLPDDQRTRLEHALKLRREALETQLAEHLHGLTRAERAHDVLTQDGDDAPQRVPERDIAAALTGLEQRELDAVATALQRIGHGEYGQCADCGVAIPFDRLLVEPWALRCVGCASARERQGQSGGGV
jgi:DnaK suppressor protein